MSLPVLVAVTLALVWVLSVGIAQVRVVDAARETARAAARGEASQDAVGRGLRVAPDGVRISLERDAGTVTAVAEGEVSGPGGVFGVLPSVTIRSTAVAALEVAP